VVFAAAGFPRSRSGTMPARGAAPTANLTRSCQGLSNAWGTVPRDRERLRSRRRTRRPSTDGAARPGTVCCWSAPSASRRTVPRDRGRSLEGNPLRAR